MEFRRSLEAKLLKWNSSKRRKPLLLLGARQVGKTSLLKKFGKNHFENYAYFNFEDDSKIAEFFLANKKIDRIIDDLSLYIGFKIDPHKTLIIFDEIQECREALTSLKYFSEHEVKYTVAAAGSLLGVTLGSNVSFPVGKVDMLYLYPLSFEEYLYNNSDTKAYQAFEHYSSSKNIEPLPQVHFDILFNIFKKYLISGGMPEAADIMINELDFDQVEEALTNINKAYTLDFSKHGIDVAKILLVYNSIPSQLSKENKKFLFSQLKESARAREYENAITWLEQAGLIHKIYKNNKPNIPLTSYDDLNAFKLYNLDVGLLGNQAKVKLSDIYQKNNIFTEFKGSLIENFVCQSLVALFEQSPKYWVSEGIAEVDFLIQYNNYVFPIEVKSFTNTKSKSFTVYNEKFDPKLRLRYSASNISLTGNLLNLPLFMIDKSKVYIDKFLI